MTQFVEMYHPLIPDTSTSPREVAVQAVDDFAARGWLLFDPDAVLPDPATPYYTKEALLSQITGGASPIGTALRAALGAVPWIAGESIAAGKFRLSPTGQIIQRTADGTTRGSFDATEAALWTVVSGGGGSSLTPTATKTGAYTAAVGDLAMMNVPAGATVLTLPTAPANKAQVGYRAIGATAATPLTINRGGSTDTIGTSGATSASISLADELVVLQYDAPNTRWLTVANVKTQLSLDARFAMAAKTAQARWNARRQANFERDNAAPFTVYVDSVNGADTNTGASPAQAWKTLAKVNTAGVAAGTRVGLARGSVFREAFTLPGTGGTTTAPIVFGAYGRGTTPVIKGSTVLSVTWTLSSGAIYTAPTTANPAVLWIDTDTCLSKAASAAAVTAGQFFSDGTTMTVWLADGTSPAAHVVEYVSGSTQGFTASGVQPYVTIQDIKVCHFGSYQLFVFNATTPVGINIKRCEIGPGIKGLIMASVGGVSEDNYVHDIWTGIEYPSGDGQGMFYTTGSDQHEVRYNLIVNCYKALTSANAHRSLQVHHNIVITPRVNGIDMEGGTVGFPNAVVNNFVWHNPKTPNGHGICTQLATTGSYWRNNIVYSDYVGASGNVELYCIDSTTYNAADTNPDYNLGWIKPGGNAVYGKLGTNTYATLAAYQAALAGTSYSGKEVHAISADPLIADLTNKLYMPLQGSPAIDAGVAVGGVTDLAGYLGVAPDMGAFEVG